MLHVAVMLFWTFVLLQIVSVVHRIHNRGFSHRYHESMRLLEDSPYFQHLGLRPPKTPIPFKMWMVSLAIWGVGIFIISRMNLVM